MNKLFTSKNSKPHYVYILKCSDNKHYTGCTNNIERRIREHNSGKVSSTRFRKPVRLITYIAFDNIYTAYRFEKYLKSGSGIAFKNKRLIP